ncbi:MAG: ABC transporter ATP-binding protein [Candidatus Hydrogenedentota bacterium]
MRLLKYWKPYIGRLALSVLCMIMYAVFSSISIISLKPLIDKILTPTDITVNITLPVINYVISGSPLYLLNILCITLVIVFILRGFTGYGQTYFMIRAGQEASFDLRNDVFRHLMSLSLDYYESKKTGDLISRLTNDMLIIQNAISNALIDMVGKPIEVIFFLGILFYISWKLTLITLIGVPLIGFLIYYTGKKCRKLMLTGQARLSDLTVIVQEAVSNIRIIKAFSTEIYESDKFRRESRKIFDTIMRLVRISVMSPYLMEFIGGMIAALLLWAGGYFIVVQKKLSAGDLFVFIFALLSSYRPAKAFLQINNLVQQAMASVSRVMDILNSRPKVVEKTNPLSKLSFQKRIIYQNVSFGYNDSLVLKDINIDLEKGKILAVVGPSGCGKTTLVSLLPRFYDVKQGCILIDNVDIRDVGLKTLRSIMGIVTQEVVLFNDNVYNNILYGLDHKPKEEDVISAAQMANAHNFIISLPDSYNTEIGDRGMKLSGGERQRIAIARAILRNPEILILDEATSALDTESEKLVQEAICNLMKGRTTLVIAHRLSTITNSDEIIILDYIDSNKHTATIVDRGDHKTLLDTCPRYKRFYEL